jgi:hypothetical protein
MKRSIIAALANLALLSSPVFAQSLAEGAHCCAFRMAARSSVTSRRSTQRSGPGRPPQLSGTDPPGRRFHAAYGLAVAYITGPEAWQIRYRAHGLAGADRLGMNP